MQVVIIGGGKVGSGLARQLVEEGHRATLVEIDPERADYLSKTLGEVKVVAGDGDEPYVLDDVELRNADAVVAATGEDEDNLVVCLLAKVEYSVPLTVARINNPSNAWLFTSRFGVDVPVSNTAIITEVLKQVSIGDFTTLLRLRGAEMVIDEVVLPEDATSVGKRLGDLEIPSCGQVMVIVSSGEVVVPRGDTVLKAGDELLILAKCDSEKELRLGLGIRQAE